MFFQGWAKPLKPVDYKSAVEHYLYGGWGQGMVATNVAKRE